MIVFKLQGGLGNQMFQYAYAKKISYKYGLDVYFDTTFYDFYDGKSTFREIGLDKFGIDIKRYNYGNKNMNIIHDTFHFREVNLDKNKDYYFDGYWQSEKYFLDIKDIIKEDFSFKEKEDKNIIFNYNTTSLHVRRTDYLSSNGFHPVQPVNYYSKAIEKIGKYDYLIVFSDDIEWCKNNLYFSNIIYISSNYMDDLYLMSICSNNIIANSSFSWWGAWLNKNNMKKVVAPTYWFNGLNSSDIIPDNWIKI